MNTGPIHGHRTTLVLLVAVVVLLILAGPAAASETQIEVNNDEANGITWGEVISQSGDGGARISVANNYSFWTAIRIIPSTSGVVLSWSEHLGGFWASQSIIPPKSKAVWDATFDPENLSIQSIQVYYGLSSAAGAEALALTSLKPALLILTASGAALGEPLIAKTPDALESAVHLLADAPEWMDFFATFQEGEAHQLKQATILVKLLSNKQARDQLAQALAKVGVKVTDKAISTAKFAWDVVWGTVVPTRDLLRAAARGQLDGIVTFSCEGSPAPVPTSESGNAVAPPSTSTAAPPTSVASSIAAGGLDFSAVVDAYPDLELVLPAQLPSGWRYGQPSYMENGEPNPTLEPGWYGMADWWNSMRDGYGVFMTDGSHDIMMMVLLANVPDSDWVLDDMWPIEKASFSYNGLPWLKGTIISHSMGRTDAYVLFMGDQVVTLEWWFEEGGEPDPVVVDAAEAIARSMAPLAWE